LKNFLGRKKWRGDGGRTLRGAARKKTQTVWSSCDKTAKNWEAMCCGFLGKNCAKKFVLLGGRRGSWSFFKKTLVGLNLTGS